MKKFVVFFCFFYKNYFFHNLLNVALMAGFKTRMMIGDKNNFLICKRFQVPQFN